MASESGWSNQKKLGESQYKTIQNLGSNQYGHHSAPKALYEVTSDTAIDAAVYDDQSQKIYIGFPSHGARLGDIIRFKDGDLEAWEMEIVEIVDADIVGVWATTPGNTLPDVGDLATILRWITYKVGSDGGIVASITAAGFSTEVKQNTQITAANLTNTKLTAAQLTFDDIKTGVDLIATKEDLIISAVDAINLKAASIIANQDYAPVNTPVYVDLSSTNITSAAYVELVATTASKARKVQIFCGNGNAAYLAFGGAGVEANKLIIEPGGNGLIDFVIPAGTRLSAKAVGTTLNAGSLIINFLG